MAVHRVERDGRLAPGWTVDAAADTIWARSHLSSWQLLVEERRWTPDDFVDRPVQSVLGELVTDP